MKLPKGFNFGGGMGNIMAEAKNAMERAKNLDNELAAERITVEQNGVTCVYDGRGMLVSLKIDKSLVDPDDVESLEPNDGDRALAAITGVARLKMSGTKAATDWEWTEAELLMAEKALKWLKMFTHVARRERHRRAHLR